MARGKAKNPENDKRAETSRNNIKKALEAKKAREQEEEYEISDEEFDELLIKPITSKQRQKQPANEPKGDDIISSYENKIKELTESHNKLLMKIKAQSKPKAEPAQEKKEEKPKPLNQPNKPAQINNTNKKKPDNLIGIRF